MSSLGACTLELLVFPIVFQTVSFHHRASYELRLSFSLPATALRPVQQLFAGEQRELVDRNGNAWNVDGTVTSRTHFRTSKFPIEYNDQIVKFKTGCLARLQSGGQERVSVYVELLKFEEEKTRGRGRRVSAEILEVNLKGGVGKNLRRVVFSTNEYISFVDVAFEMTFLSVPRPEPPRSISELYQRSVLERLKIYRQLGEKVSRKLEDFLLVKHTHPSFLHTYGVSAKFEGEFAEREVADLSYVAVSLPGAKVEDNVESNIAMQKEEEADGDGSSSFGSNGILSEHYQCQTEELQSFIEATGQLLEINIRSLFLRLMQLTICLLGEDQHLITAAEIARVKMIIGESQRLRQHSAIDIRDPEDKLVIHRMQMNTFLKTWSSISGAQLKQPYIQISNQKPVRSGRGSMEGTLTVFIHGYKGNQYDLSKIKSHLMLLLGCSHFYSIKGVSGDKAEETPIRVLAENAARELLTYLALSPTYRSINLIGFSLGGVIARAMLPWLEPQKARLNLLLTIATPHLGLRQIQNCLVRVGLCYMRRVAGIEAIRELNSQRDASASRFLLDLAKGEGLEWFRSIVLVGSFQDGYVPGYSSLVQYCGEEELTVEMGRRLSKAMGEAVRVAVRLEYRESLLDVITRRRTHISFLEEDSFIKYLLIRLQHLFAHDANE